MGTDLQIPTLNHVFFHHQDQYSRRSMLSRRLEGRRIDLSTAEFAQAVYSLSQSLQSTGVAEGDRVAILSENRPEWPMSDFATLLAGAVVVPIYPTLAPAQTKYVLSHSECSALILSTRQQWETVRPILGQLPHLRQVISMDHWQGCEEHGLIPFTTILQRIPDGQWIARSRKSALSVDPQTLATIVYTSGTTGPPKGVMLTHANVAFDLQKCLIRLLFNTVDQALSILPLSHMFERLLCYGYLYQGVPVAYGDPYELPELFGCFRPNVMGCVPRVLEKIQEAVVGQIDSMPAHRKAIAHLLLRVGQDGVEDRFQGRRPRLSTVLGSSLADKLVFSRVRQRLGGQLRYLICGGAHLDVQLEKFLEAVGINVLQGYGLSETSPVISLTPPEQAKLGTVGTPLDGVEVCVSDDGVLLTRGPHVMKGYYKDPARTRETFKDDWFITGDLGELDRAGYLTILGRQKDILVTSLGKNVSPGPIEEELRKSPFVDQAILVGDRRKFISVFIVPNQENLVQYAKAHRIGFRNFADLLESAAILDLYQKEMENRQAGFADYEKAKKFSFLEGAVLQDPDLMTPTQKVRRTELASKFRHQLDQLYQQS